MELKKVQDALLKARCYAVAGGEKILSNQLDEEHGVSASAGATALAALALTAAGRGYEGEREKGAQWLSLTKSPEGWRKHPLGGIDEEVSKVAALAVRTVQGGLISKIWLLAQIKEFSSIILGLGDNMVPGLAGPTKEEIVLPNILSDHVLAKLPQYGRPVIVAASLLSAEPNQAGGEKGLSLLYSTQGKEGAWAEDIVATSMAVLAMVRHGGEEERIGKACRWLSERQYASGGWPAFDQLKNWAMGWLACVLSEAGIKKGEYTFFRRVGVWLADSQYSDGSFGSSPPYTHPDLDDTAVGLIGLKALNKHSDKGIQLLKRLQNQDGSWGTFPTFKGFSPHISSGFPVYITSPDVTIHALEALWDQRTNQGDRAVIRGLNWLFSKQLPSGELPSVWYERPIYSTAQMLELLNQWHVPSWGNLGLDRRVNAARNKAFQFILYSQNPDGSWGKSTVETALALASLLNYPGNLPQSVVRKGIEALLNWQYEDGSFYPAYQGIYAKGWNYEEPIATALTAVRAIGRYLNYRQFA